MRIVTIELYSFKELSKQAQDAAFNFNSEWGNRHLDLDNFRKDVGDREIFLIDGQVETSAPFSYKPSDGSF